MEPVSPGSARPSFVRKVVVRDDRRSESQRPSDRVRQRRSTLQALEPLLKSRASAHASARSCPPGIIASSRDSETFNRQQAQSKITPRSHTSEVEQQSSGNPSPSNSQVQSDSSPRRSVSLASQQLHSNTESEAEMAHPTFKTSVMKTMAVLRMGGHLNSRESQATPKVMAKPKVVYSMEDAVQMLPKLPVLSFNHEHQRHFLDLPEDTRDWQTHYMKEESIKHGLVHHCPLCGDSHVFRLGESTCV
eukprot:TRINITY_DN10554_c0_g1_i2.p1 TRINITY_DN10554_c0_g1~~TRINITY_DN10554_c0_g1_i2.p1  ORF type:complete len:247 (-),score=24.72 TRINITY_DN10554_c0_g1_i2:7-747(-)